MYSGRTYTAVDSPQSHHRDYTLYQSHSPPAAAAQSFSNLTVKPRLPTVQSGVRDRGITFVARGKSPYFSKMADHVCSNPIIRLNIGGVSLATKFRFFAHRSGRPHPLVEAL